MYDLWIMRKKIKFFLEPAFQSDKWSLFLICVRNIFFGIQGSIMALSIKWIIDGANIWNYEIAWKRLIVIIVFSLMQDLPGYFFRNAYNKRFYELKVVFYQRYMWKYFTADNNNIESLGTGKIQSIIFGGCNARQTNIATVFQQWMKVLISIVLGFWLIAYNLWWKGFIIVLIVFIWSYIFVQYSNQILAKLRREKRDIHIEWDKRFVRMIMSKNEIMQNNKTVTEHNFIKTHHLHKNNHVNWITPQCFRPTTGPLLLWSFNWIFQRWLLQDQWARCGESFGLRNSQQWLFAI